MDYKIYKFRFSGMVHFGSSSLDDSNPSFMADTLFSALCHEAIKQGNDSLKRLYDLAAAGDIVMSDAFPYISDRLYLPKPYMRIEGRESAGDSVVKKAYKKLKYIPVDKFDAYLRGEFDILNESAMDIGKPSLKVSVSIRGEGETKPYRVGMYSFFEGNGLYIIVGYNRDEYISFVEELLIALSYSGIGGKRNSGLGRFDLLQAKMPDSIRMRLAGNARKKMLLSSALPREDELECAMKDASYAVIKRSGFVASDSYAHEYTKKNDLYVFKAGSCFINEFSGDIYDVSTERGNHPVYRYEKPMFLEVDA